jgi:nucleotide-binding universal stress UspA family protein
MSHQPFPIIVVLDGSEYSEIVLEHALDHASHHHGPELHFVTIVEDPHASVTDIKERMAALVLDDIEIFQRLQPDWSGHLHVRFGWPEREIPALAKEVGAKLVVLGRFDGFQLDKIVDDLKCPSLVVSFDDGETETGVCPDCNAVRRASNGEQFFCDHHKSDVVSIHIPHADFIGAPTLW